MRLLRIFIIFLMLFSFQQAVADKRPYYTLDEMAVRIQQQGAKILSAEIQQTKKGELYRFKINKDGRVRVILVRPDGSAVKKKRK